MNHDNSRITQIAAHRAGAALWAENSPTAFRNAMAMGVEQIEFDVHLSHDGVPVIHHDATLERTTNGVGPLLGKSLRELKALTLRDTDGERMMTLDEGVEILAAADVILRCEVKPGIGLQRYAGLEEKVFEVLERHNIFNRTIITSFQLEALQTVRLWPRQPLGLLWLVARQVVGCVGLAKVIELSKEQGIPELGFHCGDLTADIFLTVINAGMRCGAWAVLDDWEIGRMLDLGVSVLTTDRPDAAVKLRQTRDAATRMSANGSK